MVCNQGRDLDVVGIEIILNEAIFLLVSYCCKVSICTEKLVFMMLFSFAQKIGFSRRQGRQTFTELPKLIG